MGKEEVSNIGPSRVADFYEGKSVFLTGASGFLGTVLLECLLRCCPGIETIYILVRPRRGADVQERKAKILEKTIFNLVKTTNPISLDKIRVVEGDINQPRLGLKDADYEMLSQEISIVFHCAASIAMIKPLEFIVRLNSLSILSMIDLCKKMKKLEALIYTSTAYSNSNWTTITETIYTLPFPAQSFVDALNVSKEELHALVDKCQPPWPNTYVFSKCLAENLLAEKGSDLPFAIIRPSIIGCVHRSPLPGYIEDGSGVIALSMAIAKGFARVIWITGTSELNVVSADACANAHVISAWSLGTGRHKSPLVVNASQSRDVSTIMDYQKDMWKVCMENVWPNAFSRPTEFLVMTDNVLWYKIVAFFQHYIHAYVIDRILELSGKKPRMVSLYQAYDRILQSTYKVTQRSIKFFCENFENMPKLLHPEDVEMFNTSYDGYTFENITEMIKIGSSLLDFNTDKRTPEERKKIMNQRFWTIRFIKMTALFVFFATLFIAYLMVQKIFHSFSSVQVYEL